MHESSIKCKYCSHFEPGVNHCHLYYDFDQSLNKGGNVPYLKVTSPESRCAHFSLTAMDTVAKGVMGKRGDGSMIVSLSDDPQLKRQLEEEEHGHRANEDGKKVITVLKWLLGGLTVGFAASFIWGAIVNSPNFPVGIMLVCTFIFTCIGFFKN